MYIRTGWNYSTGRAEQPGALGARYASETERRELRDTLVSTAMKLTLLLARIYGGP